MLISFFPFFAKRRRRTASPRASRPCSTPEALEQRIAPATIVTFNSATHALSIQGDFADDGSATPQAGATEALNLLIGGGELLIADNNGAHVTLQGGGTGLTQLSASQVQIDLTQLTGPITINTGTGPDQLVFGGALTLSADQDFDATTSGRIFLGNGASISTSGAGHLNLTTADSIILQNFSSLSTVDGDLTIMANAGHTGTNSTTGVVLDQASVTTSGHGNISITGVGSGGTGFGTFGIQLQEGASISSTLSGTGAGTITLNGTGGNSDGVELGEFATGVPTNNLITSVSGAISITGTGGTASGSNSTYGISIYDGAKVTSTGTGASAATITMIGQGGTGGSVNAGISLSHFVSGFGTAVTSGDGNISLTGTGGTSSGTANNWGVAVTQGATVASTGLGGITINGTGGAGTAADYGVNISGTFTDGTPSTVSTQNSLLTVSGVSNDGSAAAVHIAVSAKVVAHGGAGISLLGDSMDLNSTIDAGTGLLSIQTISGGTTIDLGGSDVFGPGGTLGLSASELPNLGGKTISIGTQSIASGPINITQAVLLDSAAAGASVMLLTGDHDITFNGGSIDVGANNLTLTTGANGGIVTLTAGPHIDAGFVFLNAGLDGIGTPAIALHLATTHHPSLTTTSTGDQALSANGTVTIDAMGLNAGTGTIHLTGGTFVLSASGEISDGSTLDVSGASFDLGTFDETVGLAKLTSGLITGTTGHLTSAAQFDLLAGTIDVHLAGTAGLLKESAGKVTFSKSSSYTGGTTISAGTVAFSDPGAFGADSQAIILGDSNTGSADIALLATAAFAHGDFTRAITVANQGTGTVTIGTDAAGLSSPTEFDSPLSLFRAVTLQGNNPASTHFSGTIIGSVGTLTIAGGKTVVLDPPSSNGFSGSVAITGAGTILEIASDTFPLPSSTSVDVGAGTTFMLKGTPGGGAAIDALTGSGTVTIDPTLTNNPLTLTIGSNGAHATFSGVIKDGGTGSPLSLVNLGSETLSGALSYSGTTLVQGGTLELAGSSIASHSISVTTGSLQIDSANLLASASVDISSALGLKFGGTAASYSIGELTGTGMFDLSKGGGTNPAAINLQVGNLNTDFSFGGTLTGPGSLTKIGTGTLTLTSDNFFTGDTNVTSGHIVLDSIDSLQGSTIAVAHAGDFAFASGHTDFDLGGLKGAAPLVISDQAGLPFTLHVGGNNQDTTYSGALSGAGALAKSGNGTLTLTGKNQQALGTLVESGTLVVSSDQNLGRAGVELAFAGGTLSAAKTFTTARPIALLTGTDTLAATAGHTLTVKGPLSGTGNLGITGAGRVVIVENENSTNSGGESLDASGKAVVNGVSVKSPGEKGEIMIMPGATPGDIAMIDLSGATKIGKLIISAPKGKTSEVDQILDMSESVRVKSIILGKGVTFGNGMADGTPDLMLEGALGSLTLDSVNANAIIELGKDLPYHVTTGKNPLDTYHNHPNVTFGNVLGAGVTLDVTGDGIAGGMGGGGLGKVVVNSWSQPGTIETTQGIKSILIRHGDFDGDVQVDPNHLGEFTVANVGSVSIPQGTWAGTGLQVEGVVAQFLTKGIQQGTLIQAGAFGKVTIKGTYAGDVIALADPSVTTGTGAKTKIIATGDIASVAIAGDFTGLIAADGAVGNVTLSGTAHFMGSLQGQSLGNISAFSYEGNPGQDPMTPRQSITSATTIGAITATGGGLNDYIIEAGANLGHDHVFGGGDDAFTGSYASGAMTLGVHITSVTVKSDVIGTTIAAGVIPGGTGLFGSSDTAAPHAAGVLATIGAMKFGGTDESVATSPATMGATVSNAFEAGTLTSILCGTGAHAVTTKTFTTTQYLNGSDTSVATLIRLI